VTLRLRSQRPLADPSDRLETALPVCDVPVVHAGDVAIYAAENIEARLTAATGVALRTPANEFAESFADAPGLLRREARLVEPATGRLAVTIGRRNRRVQGHWGVQVEVADGVARVRQRLELDVEYVPLEELPLLLPEPLRRVPLNAELQQRRVATAPDRASGEWRLPLEPARTGRVVWQGWLCGRGCWRLCSGVLVGCPRRHVWHCQEGLQDCFVRGDRIRLCGRDCFCGNVVHL
jgi:hypothetical protein